MVRVELERGMRFVGRGESGHEVVMDAGARGGGADSAARPIDVFLSALGGCTGMDVIAILRKMRTEPSRLAIEIEGTRADEPPRPFKKIHLTYVVAGSVPEENLRKAIDLSLTKYCSVANTVTGVAEITTDVRIEPE
jgi:putative redox protein